jgi:GNAT superfamily N-acetyltransferase
VTVRRATADDAEAIERIRHETWEVTYRGLLPDPVIDRLGINVHARRRRLGAQTPDELNLVAVDAGAVVGYAFAGPERTHDAEYHGEVYAIYVLPAHHGKGHGRALIGEAARELAARGITSLLIWVLRENLIGRRFYERLGGRPVREKPLDLAGAEKNIEIGYGWLDTAPLRQA